MVYWVAIAMTIVANLTYHLCMKTAAPVNPLVSLMVTYSVALLSCVVLYPFLASDVKFVHELRQLNASSVILGLAIVMLECGFILAYRAGWNVGYAALFSNVSVTLLLIPFAIFFFRNEIGTKNFAGILLALIGLLLMAN